MADCFPPAPVNPLNTILLEVFGDNYFPPYNTGFQPTSRSDMTNDKLLQMQTPGGGKIKPTGDPVSRHISEILSPVTGALGLVFAFFGPLFLILDLIRAIIDIICAFFNPVPVIAAVVELFITVIPPVIALYPPLSTILHALNTAKLVTSIVVALTSSIIAIIDKIVENALSITDLIAEGNVAAVEAVATKICVLIENFANELGAFAPISFIIELLELFMSLGSKFFCASDAVCCDPESCPPIILDPPTGTGFISFSQTGLTLGDILSFLVDADTKALLDEFVLIQPEMLLTTTDGRNLRQLNDYIVEPDKIPGAASEADPATVRVRVTNETTNVTITARATEATSNTIRLRADDFPLGSFVSYTVEPDQVSLLKLNLIGLGCEDDIREAAGGVERVFDEATFQGRQIVGPGSGPLDPLVIKMGGQEFPPVPLPDYNECLERQQADPTTSQAQCIFDISSSYLDDVKNFALDLVCIGADRANSTFEADRLFATADSKDGITLSLTINDANGVNLLENFLPNAIIPTDFDARFATTRGSIGPVVFDDASSSFRATLTSDSVGSAEVTAAFQIRGQTCMEPGTSDGFSISDQVIEVQFRPIGGDVPRRRRRPTYVQSGGGRRR